MKAFVKSTLFGFSVLLLLTACSDKQQNDTKAPLADSVEQTEVFSQPDRYQLKDPTYLRQRVPLDALAYGRVPHLFSYVSAPKGDVFTRALQQDEYRKLIEPLKNNLYQMLADSKMRLPEPILAFWIQHSRSPLEFAIIQHKPQPLPVAMFTTTLDINSRKAFATYLQKLVKDEPSLYLLKDNVLDSGHASLSSGPLSIELGYDASSKRLSILTGMGVTRELLIQHFDQLAVQKTHPLLTAEAAIDSSHQGLFAWLNLEQILPIVANTMPPEKFSAIKNSLLGEAKAISAGIGISGGKGRVKLIADFNANALVDTLPTGGLNINLHAAGKIRTLAAISLISAKQLNQLEQHYFKLVPGKNVDDYQASKQKLTDTMGMSPEELLKAIGPEIFFLADSIGEYSVIAIRDKALYEQLLERRIQAGKIDYSKQVIDGVPLHQIKTTPWFIPSIDAIRAAAREPNPFIDLLVKAKSHVYWIEENNYLVFAAVPQLLIDRAHSKHKIQISDWLKLQQRQEIASSLFLASTSIQGSPARLYYAYLQTLLFLGDISDTDIDITRMPSAASLSLPESGTYGFQIAVSDRQVFSELVFENNPAEIVLGQNMSSIAVVGILAAIAIPAYQDYTIRAKVMQAYQQTELTRHWVDEYHRQQGKFPTQAAINQLDLSSMLTDSISALEIEPQTGRINITLSGHKLIQNKSLTLTPDRHNNATGWKCTGKLKPDYLPTDCR